MAIKKIPCGGFYTSDGNFTNIDGKKVLTPLGAYRVTNHEDVTMIINNENFSFSQAGYYNFMVSNNGVILDPSHTYTFIIDGTRFENLIPYKRVYLTDPPEVEYHIGAYFTGAYMPFTVYPFVVTPRYIVLPESSEKNHVITLIDEGETVTQPMDKSLFFDFGISCFYRYDSIEPILLHGSYENIKKALTNGKVPIGYIRETDTSMSSEIFYTIISNVGYSPAENVIQVAANGLELFILEDNTIVTELEPEPEP